MNDPRIRRSFLQPALATAGGPGDPAPKSPPLPIGRPPLGPRTGTTSEPLKWQAIHKVVKDADFALKRTQENRAWSEFFHEVGQTYEKGIAAGLLGAGLTWGVLSWLSTVTIAPIAWTGGLIFIALSLGWPGLMSLNNIRKHAQAIRNHPLNRFDKPHRELFSQALALVKSSMTAFAERIDGIERRLEPITSNYPFGRVEIIEGQTDTRMFITPDVHLLAHREELTEQKRTLGNSRKELIEALEHAFNHNPENCPNLKDVLQAFKAALNPETEATEVEIASGDQFELSIPKSLGLNVNHFAVHIGEHITADQLPAVINYLEQTFSAFRKFQEKIDGIQERIAQGENNTTWVELDAETRTGALDVVREIESRLPEKLNKILSSIRDDILTGIQEGNPEGKKLDDGVFNGLITGLMSELETQIFVFFSQRRNAVRPVVTQIFTPSDLK